MNAQKTPNQNSNLVVLAQSVNRPGEVLTWAIEHHIDFDFHYFKTVMEPEELALYKHDVIEHTIEFFRSLMD